MNKPYSCFFTILIAFICTSCDFFEGKNSQPTGDIICDKIGRKIFYNCLVKNIPLGSNYEDLNDFLVLHDFGSLNLTPAPDEGYKFYFDRSANNIANYRIGVIGRTNSNLEVIEMEMR